MEVPEWNIDADHGSYGCNGWLSNPPTPQNGTPEPKNWRKLPRITNTSRVPFITINRSTGEVSCRPQYYTFGHSSKFVRPGAYRVKSSDTSAAKVDNVAFVNADGSLIVIVLNSDRSQSRVRIAWKSQGFDYILPPRSAVTFKWLDKPNANAQVWLTTGDQAKLLSREPDVHF